jgi:hypothetical protein
VDAPIRGNVRSDDEERSIGNALELSRLATFSPAQQKHYNKVAKTSFERLS